MFKTGLVAAALMLMAGCVYDPYYVRGDGTYGDAYYGASYYDDGPYYGGGYYYSPGYYYPSYYWGPSFGLGLYYSDYGHHYHHGGWNSGHHGSWNNSYHSTRGSPVQHPHR